MVAITAEAVSQLASILEGSFSDRHLRALLTRADGDVARAIDLHYNEVAVPEPAYVQSTASVQRHNASAAKAATPITAAAAAAAPALVGGMNSAMLKIFGGSSNSTSSSNGTAKVGDKRTIAISDSDGEYDSDDYSDDSSDEQPTAEANGSASKRSKASSPAATAASAAGGFRNSSSDGKKTKKRRRAGSAPIATVEDQIAAQGFIAAADLPDMESDEMSVANTNVATQSLMNRYHANEAIQVKVTVSGKARWFRANIEHKIDVSGGVIVKFVDWSDETRRMVPITDVAKHGTHALYQMTAAEAPERIWPAESPVKPLSDDRFDWGSTMWQSIGSIKCIVTSELPLRAALLHASLSKCNPSCDQQLYDNSMRDHSQAITEGDHRFVMRWLDGIRANSSYLNAGIQLQELKGSAEQPATTSAAATAQLKSKQAANRSNVGGNNISNNISLPARNSDAALASWCDVLIRRRLKAGGHHWAQPAAGESSDDEDSDETEGTSEDSATDSEAECDDTVSGGAESESDLEMGGGVHTNYFTLLRDTRRKQRKAAKVINLAAKQKKSASVGVKREPGSAASSAAAAAATAAKSSATRVADRAEAKRIRHLMPSADFPRPLTSFQTFLQNTKGLSKQQQDALTYDEQHAATAAWHLCSAAEREEYYLLATTTLKSFSKHRASAELREKRRRRVLRKAQHAADVAEELAEAAAQAKGLSNSSKACSAWRPSVALKQQLSSWSYWEKRGNQLDEDLRHREQSHRSYIKQELLPAALALTHSTQLITYLITVNVQINLQYDTTTSKKAMSELPFNELMYKMHPHNTELEVMTRQAEAVMLPQFYNTGITLDGIVKLCVRRTSNELFLKETVTVGGSAAAMAAAAAVAAAAPATAEEIAAREARELAERMMLYQSMRRGRNRLLRTETGGAPTTPFFSSTSTPAPTTAAARAAAAAHDADVLNAHNSAEDREQHAAALAAYVAPYEVVTPRLQELLDMSEDELSAACALTLTVYDYQKQSILWMVAQEQREASLSAFLWVPLQFKHQQPITMISASTNNNQYHMPNKHAILAAAPAARDDDTAAESKARKNWVNRGLLPFRTTEVMYYYSPFLQKFQLSPLSPVKGGWCAEEMGLGKTIMSLALIQLQRREGFEREYAFGVRATADSTQNSTSTAASAKAAAAPKVKKEAAAPAAAARDKRAAAGKASAKIDSISNNSDDGDDGFGGQKVHSAEAVMTESNGDVHHTEIDTDNPGSSTDSSNGSSTPSPSPVPKTVAAAPKAARQTKAAQAATAAAQEWRTDDDGLLISGATLIVCSTSLIGQWLNEMLEKSAVGLRVLSFYGGSRPKLAAVVAGYDVVITSYGVVTSEGNLANNRREKILRETPWKYEGRTSPNYLSCLQRINWHRVILDEGHTIKSLSTRQSRFLLTLKSEHRWLLTGTPLNMRPDDLRGQIAFLQLDGLEGHFWTDVDNVVLKSNRPWKEYQAVTTSCEPRDLLENDDIADARLKARWFHRTANTIFSVVKKCMVRHSKVDGYDGRATLLTLPPKAINHEQIVLDTQQRQVYDVLYQHAKKRFERLKRQNLAVARVIQVMQMLMPVRQACSGGAVTVRDAIQRMQNEVQYDDDDESNRINKAAVLDLNLNIITVATAEALGDLTDECTICLEVLEEPLQTPCRHMFCADCIKGVLSVIAMTQRCCPLCRTALKIEDLSVPQGSKIAVKREKAAAAAAAAAGVGGDTAMAVDEDGNEVTKIGDVDLSTLPATVTFDHKLLRLIDELQLMLSNDSGSKALVFTQFKQTMDFVKAGLEAAGVLYQTIEGHMTMTQRKKALDRFRATSETNVFLLSVRAGAVGLTLTAADHVFFIEPCLNPAIELQAIGRVHRIGQNRPVHIKYLIVKDTIEEKLMAWNSQRMKDEDRVAPTAAAAAADADNIKVKAEVKSEFGVKKEKGTATTAAAATATAASSGAGSVAVTGGASHANVIPGNVQADVVPLRLAEMEILFGD